MRKPLLLTGLLLASSVWLTACSGDSAEETEDPKSAGFVAPVHEGVPALKVSDFAEGWKDAAPGPPQLDVCGSDLPFKLTEGKWVSGTDSEGRLVHVALVPSSSSAFEGEALSGALEGCVMGTSTSGEPQGAHATSFSTRGAVGGVVYSSHESGLDATAAVATLPVNNQLLAYAVVQTAPELAQDRDVEAMPKYLDSMLTFISKSVSGAGGSQVGEYASVVATLPELPEGAGNEDIPFLAPETGVTTLTD